jgi:hypothetical protein
MTELEFNKLSLSQLYEFKLYYGKTLIGYLEKDNSSGKYFVKRPNLKYSEEVKIEQIENWSIWNKDKTQYLQSDDSTIYNNPRSKKLIILGAGASFDFDFNSLEILSPTRLLPVS